MNTLQKLTIQEGVRRKSLGDLSVINALAQLHLETAHRLAPSTVKNRNYTAVPLSRFFGNKPLRAIRANDLAKYQVAGLEAGKSTSTINQELNILSLLLRRAKLWHRFETYRSLPRREPPTGKALTEDEVRRLFAVAYVSERRRAAADALSLAFATGMRTTEIKQIKWRDVNFPNQTLSISHSKTPAGWRTIALNETALTVLQRRMTAGIPKGQTESDHYVFPSRNDPLKPVHSFFAAWNSIRKEAQVSARFHDTRHTAVTRLQEAGLPEAVIRAQVGHRTQLLLNIYTHPRSAAMRQAAETLDRKPPVSTKEESHQWNSKSVSAKAPVPGNRPTSPTSRLTTKSRSSAAQSGTASPANTQSDSPAASRRKESGSQSSSSRRPPMRHYPKQS